MRKFVLIMILLSFATLRESNYDIPYYEERFILSCSIAAKPPSVQTKRTSLRDDFWACPAAEEFAEWLRGNLCIPDQEYVDPLVTL